MGGMTLPRWFTDTSDDHSQWYIERFRKLADEGADLTGEARLVDAVVAPGSVVLDAGCGPGRIAGELHRRGHRVVGVDVDPALIEAAEADQPGPDYHVADLSELDLPEQRFDAVVMAGNVLVFVAEGTEPLVLARLAAHLRPGGKLLIGCRLDRSYSVDMLDAHAEAAGLHRIQRFSTWDLDPFTAESDFAVSIFRSPEQDGGSSEKGVTSSLSLHRD